MSHPEISPAVQSTGDVGGKTGASKRSMQGPLICLVLGIVGGGAAGLLMNRTIEFFPVIEPPEVANTQGIHTPEQKKLVDEAHLRADYRNMFLNAGLLGLMVTAVLGLAHGLISRLPSAAITGLFAGGISGAVFGACGGLLAVVIREQLDGWSLITEQGAPDPLRVQIHTMLIQSPAWVGIAAALGVTFFVSSPQGRRQFVPVVVAALVGWLLTSLLYPTFASVVFPHNDPDLIIPGGYGNRLFWSTFTAGVIGFLIGRNYPAGAPVSVAS